ncbi:MAG TPA: hypothetical protein VFL57_17445 [Bryobacteraceae bacterium]|nr:hypothetical protein [Bryobacteraceae bacterium]
MRCLLLLVTLSLNAQTLEQQALTLERDLQARHLPFGTILDPMFAGPESAEIIGYTRCGDSAIWTGHYLAAEAFRYSVTRSSDALAAADRGLRGLELLVRVSGADNVLARCAVPADSVFAEGMLREESQHDQHSAVIDGRNWRWVGDTSRDQYMGAFFGLSVAFERIDDPGMRGRISDLVTRLVDRLLDKHWSVVMPGGNTSTTFTLRPEQQAAILQVARQVNPARFARVYDDWRPGLFGIGTAVAFDTLDPHGSYFKFNLDAITFYNLVRLEPRGSERLTEYWNTYERFHAAIRLHQNAHFNAIDRALRGPEGKRDAETIELLNEWLRRPRRDFFVDLRAKYRSCGENRACDVIPVRERVTTDFLWQRSPFQLSGGGSGRIEPAGIDFILPYWMSRAYGVTSPIAIVSAASGAMGVAPGGLASAYGTGFGASGARVEVRDAAGALHIARVFYSSDEQINFEVPAAAAAGPATFTVVRASGGRTDAVVLAQRVAPALFTANMTGRGPAAGVALRTERDGRLTQTPLATCFGPLLCQTVKVETSDRPVYLSLFGTGFRHRTGLEAVRVTIASRPARVLYAGPQPEFAGLDQLNVEVPREARGAGETDLILTADGVQSNAVRVRID